MKEIFKLKKKYKVYSILLESLMALLILCLILVEILSNLENDKFAYIFLGFFIGFVVCIVLVIFLGRKNQKIADTLQEKLSKEIPLGYTYQSFVQISDLIQDGKFPCTSNTEANAYESIQGVIDGIPFAYYFCGLWQDSFFKDIISKKYDLFVFNNVSTLQKNFIVSTLKAKKLEKLEKRTSTDKYTIYSTENLEAIELAGEILFLSLQHNTLYIFKKSSRKKALYLDVKSTEEFNQKFMDILEEVKKTYEEASAWLNMK